MSESGTIHRRRPALEAVHPTTPDSHWTQAHRYPGQTKREIYESACRDANNFLLHHGKPETVTGTHQELLSALNERIGSSLIAMQDGRA